MTRLRTSLRHSGGSRNLSAFLRQRPSSARAISSSRTNASQTFPTALRADALTRANIATTLAVILSQGSSVQRILIVEDEELISLFLREELSDVGFHVDVRAEGAAGMSLCRERRYSAAIVDVGLPDMSGVDVARRCREIDMQLPIVLATGSNTREISEMFAQDACVQVLEKPYETTALLDCLTTLGVNSRAQ